MSRPQPTLDEALPPTSVSPGPARLLFPDEFTDDDTDQVATPPKGRAAGRRIGRLAAYGAVGLLAGASLFFLGAVLAPPPTPPPPPAVEPGTAPALLLSPQARVDRLADTLALATGAFDLRLRLFQSHQMECPDLARGLVVVEERWAEYSAARTAGGVVQDSARASLDRSLYAGVDATERQFEQSKCPRP